ncbi:MAG: formate dehydrogenase accessory sulfurtransferase FdhD [Deltaproteobacteria bacterium]|nr:MAG: formate dehydrogenase accessory sulfurtransferase FdhD [Deltaproteobacteria bacterium]
MFPIQRVTKEGKNDTEDLVTRELPLTIILNNQELVTLLCSPTDLKYLAIGFLSSEGLVKSKDEIKKITIDDQRGVVRVETEEDKDFASELVFKRFITSGCGRGASFYSAADVQGQRKIESQMRISAPEILALVKELQNRSKVYRTTGGVHSAGLCDSTSILVFAEDIGRHNAIDKIFGQSLLEGIPTEDRAIITSGRISSEILLKVAKRNIPVIMSRSAPTDLGVRLADELGITLIGFVRGKRMNVYSHEWRIVTDGE